MNKYRKYISKFACVRECGSESKFSSNSKRRKLNYHSNGRERRKIFLRVMAIMIAVIFILGQPLSRVSIYADDMSGEAADIFIAENASSDETEALPEEGANAADSEDRASDSDTETTGQLQEDTEDAVSGEESTAADVAETESSAADETETSQTEDQTETTVPESTEKQTEASTADQTEKALQAEMEDVAETSAQPDAEGRMEKSTEQTEETTEKPTKKSAEDADVEAEELDKADYSGDDTLAAATLHGEAAESRSAAKDALSKETSLSSAQINDIVAELFDNSVGDTLTLAEAAEIDDNTDPVEDTIYPRAGDGSSIESITAKWLTPDATDNDLQSVLYVRPSANETQNLRLQINYALSGEHNYEPGDITITVPAYIFDSRTGQPTGNLIIPFPEDPSTKKDFNYKLIGGNYILTNTKKMSAATKGFIQFAYTSLTPSSIVDMELSDAFSAAIEVITHKGNVLALHSNDLYAQIDTEARVTNAAKLTYGSPQRVSKSSLTIPAALAEKYADEEEFIKVNWYTWAVTKANTEYTLDATDTLPDEVNGTAVPDYDGFIIGSEDGRTLTKNAIYTGHRSGETTYYYYSTAYPASQFEPDTNYTFYNNITYTLTEKDPEVSFTNPNVQEEDPQLVTTVSASAQTTWSFTNPVWHDPQGHFNVFKNGNDDKYQGSVNKYNYTHSIRYTGSYSDQHLGTNGYYGIYPSAINVLQDGEDVCLSYTINTVGYIMPWTYKTVIPGTVSQEDSTQWEIPPTRIIGNYFQRPVRMTTTDTGVSIGRYGEKLKVFEAYEFVSVEIVDNVYVYTGEPHNINDDGTWTAMYAEDGTFLYSRDTNKTHYPDIKLEIQRAGAWELYAKASWKSGSLVVTLANGSTQTSGVIAVPADTENIRTVVDMDNPDDRNAAINYDIRPVIKLKNTAEMAALVEEAFARTNTPEMFIYNSTNMFVEYMDEDADIVSIDKDGYDSIRGYTTDTAVYPSKTSSQSDEDVDYNNGIITIHYTAKVEERSVINDRTTYEQAIADGRLLSESHGIWRDLLPKGVVPLVETVKLRSGDYISQIYTIENYRNSGRTLLVVEADLTPMPQTYRSGDMYYFEDVPTITFGATYSIESINDYGDHLHNVISFESSNETMGTVDGYRGEADDATQKNNVLTDRAFADDAERSLMKDLAPDRDDPSFVYAGTTTRLTRLAEGQIQLTKHVQVNNDGWWSSGIYYNDPDGNRRDVYSGGLYSYRLRVLSTNEKTESKNIIIYDSLENFYATVGNDMIDTADVGAERWNGTLVNVDLSQLVSKGCAPVLYYSLVEGLELSDESGSGQGVPINNDLSDTNIWIRADQYSGDIAAVKAIAVDASMGSDGQPFILEPFDADNPDNMLVVIINMRAPYGKDADRYIGENAHAYNNAYMTATTVNTETHDEDPNNFVRIDYTKVGLMEYNIDVAKRWSDDNNRDGLRPENGTVTFWLYANGVKTDRSVTIDSDNPTATFTNIPYTDENGDKIIYSVREEPMTGYRPTLQIAGSQQFIYTNVHIPERINISGNKRWIGDSEQVRPESIQVRLMMRTSEDETPYPYSESGFTNPITVTPDKDGNWTFEFANVFRYQDGKEIIYSVEELNTRAGELASYVPSYEENNRIVNTYHPKGDLMVSKSVEDVTAVSGQKQFSFTFNFYMEEDGAHIPFIEDYKYVILEDGADEADVDWSTVTDTLRSGSAVAIKGGQKIYVKDIDEYVKYSVQEEDLPGFTLSSYSGSEGTIKPNDTAVAAFTNTYSAKGQINLGAEKTLENKELSKFQFKFELYQIIQEANADTGEITETESLIRTATNDRPDPESGVTKREDETVESSVASVTFGAIRYTQDDVNAQAESGQPYRYKVVETDAGKPGYTYDETIYYAEVSVTDNGDGTLKIEETYFDEEGNEVEKAAFTNTYKAEGELPLRAWKDLIGRSLKDGEFTFELLDEEGNPIVNKELDGAGKPVEGGTETPVTATNEANGTITFSPDNVQALHFDETYIGKTVYFAIREVPGADSSVNYDDSVYGYSIEILDNGDGSLSFNQGLATPIYKTNVCENCNGIGYLGSGQYIGPGGDGGEYLTTNSYDFTITDGLDYSMEDVFIDDCGGTKADFDNYVQTLTAIKNRMLTIGSKTTGSSADLLQAVGKPWERHNDEDREAILEECDFTPFTYIQSIDFSGHDDALNALIADLSKYCSEGFSTPVWDFNNLAEHGVGRVQIVMDTPEYRGVYFPAHLYRHANVYAYEACELCEGEGKTFEIIGWNTEEAPLPVFTNTLRPGSLSVSKYIENAESADPEQEFNFYVKLIGDVADGEMDYTVTAAPEKTSGDSETGSGGNGVDTREAAVKKALSADTAVASKRVLEDSETSIIKSGTFCGVSYRITSAGEMIFGNGGEQTFDLRSFNYINLLPDWEVNTGDYSDPPNAQRYYYTRQVKSIRVDGTVHLKGSLYLLFNGGTKGIESYHNGFCNLETVDFTGMDFDGCTDMTYTFANCFNLKKVVMGETYSAPGMSMYGAFMASGIKELDMSNFDTSNVTTMANMFAAVKLEKITLAPGCTLKNKVKLNDPPANSTYSGNWTNGADVLTANNYNTYPIDMAGTWVWEKAAINYTVKFDAGEGSGSMASVTLNARIDQTLPKNLFVKPGYSFDHWEVTSVNDAAPAEEATYTNKGTIPAGVYSADDAVTLTAIFTPRDTTVNIVNGEFDFILYGGETATFEGFPAGTAYQVWEETPDGWILVEQSNVSGTIEPLEMANASFTNRYQPDMTTAQFTGTKTLDGQAADAGEFSFMLTEVGNTEGSVKILGDGGAGADATLPITVSTTDGGFIQFPVLMYDDTMIGEHTYQISEVNPNRADIDYDTHTETITVKVTDNGDGTLSTEVSENARGFSFANRTRPGTLELTKTAEDSTTDANKDDEFTFEVTFNNSHGIPISESDIYWYIKDDYEGGGSGPQIQNAPVSAASRLQRGIIKTGTRILTLENVDLSGYPTDGATISHSGTSGTVRWEIYSDGTMIFRPVSDNEGTISWPITLYWGEYKDTRPWADYKTEIKRVTTVGTIHLGATAPHMFRNCTNLVAADLSGFEVSQTEYLNNMFDGCSSLSEVDVSTWETSSLVRAEYMFRNCVSLTSLDFPGLMLKAGAQECTVANMFGNCSSLQHLDISGLNSSQVGSWAEYIHGSYVNYPRPGGMTEMFYGCSSLNEIVLGPDFKFDHYTDRNGLDWRQYNPQVYLKLPMPPDSSEGKWVRSDYYYDPMTPAELTENWTSAYAGTWVWYNPSKRSMVSFDANGGYTSAANITLTSTSADVNIPDSSTTTWPHHILTGWNTKADGSGTTYVSGATETGIVELGTDITLYAQWEETNLREYKVEHYQQKGTLDGYELYGTDTLTSDKGSEVNPEVKTFDGFISPERQCATVADDDSTVIRYYYDRETYSIIFDGNGATSGQMDDQKMVVGFARNLDKNIYQRSEYIFTGWNTEASGSGIPYSDMQSVRDLADQPGKIVTLYAQWLHNPNDPLEPTYGKVTVKCKAGQTVVFPGLPAGTTYSIVEISNPEGWTQTGTVGENGTIYAAKTSEAEITNKYTATGEVMLHAHKLLAGRDAEDGQFTFELLDSDQSTVLDTVTNEEVDTNDQVLDEEGNSSSNEWKGTAPVNFNLIELTQGDIGEKVFYIREKAGDDSSIAYDSSVYRVMVEVSDAGKGRLICTVNYEDGAEPLFINTLNPGKLSISKIVTGDKGPDVTPEFAFKIELKDADGNPLDGEYKTKRHASGNIPVVVTAYSSNLNDQGVQISDITYRTYARVVSIPGADSVHVKLKYSEPRGTGYPPGFFYVFDSALDGIAGADNVTNIYSLMGLFMSMSQQGIAPLKIYTPEGNSGILTDEFDVEGDGVSFLYISNPADPSQSGYSTSDNYGFFAEVSGGAEYTAGTVRDGDTVYIGEGETLDIEELPAGTNYSVTELSKEGWSLVSSENTSGTITAAQSAEASFTNTYEQEAPPVYTADGSVQFKAHKTMRGALLSEDDGFVFELVDESGAAIQTKSTDEVDVSESDITFDVITYSEKDIGKTYNYIIREKSDGDTSMIYDSRVYEARVAISDNGDSTLKTETTYWLLGENADYDTQVSSADFVNTKVGHLRITKSLDTKENVSGRIDPATFVFSVDVTYNGDIIYSDVISMVFDAACSQSVELGTFPAGAVARVSEVYAGGNYRPVSSSVVAVGADGTAQHAAVEIVGDDMVQQGLAEMAEAAFTNTYDTTWHGGGSVANNIGADGTLSTDPSYARESSK